MSEYGLATGGSLKLKGGVAEGGIVKKKKKKSKSKSESGKDNSDLIKEFLEQEESSTASGSDRNSPAIGGGNSKKTDAEKRFEEIKRRRMAEKVAKLAKKTHKDRVSEFNAHLESLSEHHDIPKVGPG